MRVGCFELTWPGPLPHPHGGFSALVPTKPRSWSTSTSPRANSLNSLTDGTFVQVRWRFCNGDCRCGCVDTTDRRAVCPCSRTVFPPRTTTSTVSLRLTLPSALRRREARSAITTARSLAQSVQTASRFEPFVPGDQDTGLTAVSPTAIQRPRKKNPLCDISLFS